MRHQAVTQRVVDLIHQIGRLGAEHVGTGNDHLLAYADEQVCIARQVRTDEIKMLHDHALLQPDGVHDGFGQNVRLGKAHLKTDVQMIGMRRIKAVLFGHIQNGQGAYVDAVIVVGQLQAREHAVDERAFAGARIADKADQTVIGAQVHLAHLHAKVIHTRAAARGEIGGLDQVSLHSVGIRHDSSPLFTE